MDGKKEVWGQTVRLLVGECVCLAVMFLVYFLLGRLDSRVLLGGILGTVLATANFFIMAANATVAAEKAVQQDVKGGAMLMRTSYIIRLIIMFVILFAAVKSGYCDAIASIVPIALSRWILTLGEFFGKKGDA
ncbi:MAG: ATP synthase subunit I [Clostridia bacterium]|nr:ATP synthase subunit I [Clostridia bacterium]